jgi:hypothetical protein
MDKNFNDKIHNITNDIIDFIDKEYKTIGVKDSLWKDDKQDDDMIYPTDLCEEIRSYLIDKLTGLKGEE